MCAAAAMDTQVPLSHHQNGWLHVRRVSYTDECSGRGVFALRDIPCGVLLDESPCIRVPASEHNAHVQFTIFNHYTFRCNDGDYLLALGYGSLFNHSNTPNVDYRVDAASDTIRYTTARAIAAGEELCIFYGPNLWFVDGRANGTVSCSNASSTVDAAPLPFAVCTGEEE